MKKSVLMCALVGAAVASASAGAAGPAYQSYPVKDGIMQFPNVIVINKPMDAAAQAPVSHGIKAYIDESGNLRAPTNEELQAEAVSSKSASTSAPQARRTTASAATARAATMADGTETVVLDESTLLNAVMVRQPDGSLTEVCVPGDEAAAIHAGKIDVRTVAKKEQSNDR